MKEILTKYKSQTELREEIVDAIETDELYMGAVGAKLDYLEYVDQHEEEEMEKDAAAHRKKIEEIRLHEKQRKAKFLKEKEDTKAFKKRLAETKAYVNNLNTKGGKSRGDMATENKTALARKTGNRNDDAS